MLSDQIKYTVEYTVADDDEQIIIRVTNRVTKKTKQYSLDEWYDSSLQKGDLDAFRTMPAEACIQLLEVANIAALRDFFATPGLRVSCEARFLDELPNHVYWVYLMTDHPDYEHRLKSIKFYDIDKACMFYYSCKLLLDNHGPKQPIDKAKDPYVLAEHFEDESAADGSGRMLTIQSNNKVTLLDANSIFGVQMTLNTPEDTPKQEYAWFEVTTRHGKDLDFVCFGCSEELYPELMVALSECMAQNLFRHYQPTEE